MSKLFSLLLVLGLVATTTAACGGGGGDTAPTDGASPEATEAPAESPSPQ